MLARFYHGYWLMPYMNIQKWRKAKAASVVAPDCSIHHIYIYIQGSFHVTSKTFIRFVCWQTNGAQQWTHHQIINFFIVSTPPYTSGLYYAYALNLLERDREREKKKKKKKKVWPLILCPLSLIPSSICCISFRNILSSG